MPPLTIGETARARFHTYTLLSRLYLDGLVAELVPYVQALPALAESLPSFPDLAEATAGHYRLFGLNIFPYETVFLDPAGLLGGALSGQVARRYHADGYSPGPDVAPDHVGHELGLLAHLCAVEADACEDGYLQLAQQLQQRQQSFLAQHLARWLPPFLVALRRQQDPFYRALAGLTWEVVGDHLQEEPAPWSLPPSPGLLADENIGLRQIATTLLTPPLSGFFLSRDDINHLAGHHTLPRGFGNRQQILLNLFRSAAQYEQFPALLTDLQTLVAGWLQAYADHAPTAPTLAGSVTIWRHQLENTNITLARLWEKAEAFTASL